MELINREDVIYAIVNTPSEPDWNIMPNRTTFRTGSAFRQHEIIDIINKMPVIESRPKGKWIKESDYKVMGDGYMWNCSECGNRVYVDSNGLFPNYCEDCGTDMRGEE